MAGNANERGTVTPESLRAEGLNPEQVLQHLGLKRLGTVRNQLLQMEKAGYDEATLIDTVIPLWGITFSEVVPFLEQLNLRPILTEASDETLSGAEFFHRWINPDLNTPKLEVKYSELAKIREHINQRTKFVPTPHQFLQRIGIVNLAQTREALFQNPQADVQLDVPVGHLGMIVHISLAELTAILDDLRASWSHLPGQVLSGSEWLAYWVNFDASSGLTVTVNEEMVKQTRELLQNLAQRKLDAVQTELVTP